MLKVNLPGEKTACIASDVSEPLYVIVEKIKQSFLNMQNRNISGQFQIVRFKDNTIELIDQNTKYSEYPAEQLQFRQIYYMCSFPGISGFSYETENLNTELSLNLYEQFIFNQRVDDFISGRSVYPVKRILGLAALILASKYGKFDHHEHSKHLSNAMEHLPAYLKNISNWSKKYQFGQSFTTLPGFQQLTSSNYELIFTKALETAWKSLKENVFGMEAAVTFLSETSHGQLTSYAQSRCFQVRSTGSLVSNEAREGIIIAIGPNGLTLLDPEDLTMGSSFQLVQLDTVNSDGVKLTFKTGQNATVRFEFDDPLECLEAHSLIAGYLQLFSIYTGNRPPRQ